MERDKRFDEVARRLEELAAEVRSFGRAGAARPDPLPKRGEDWYVTDRQVQLMRELAGELGYSWGELEGSLRREFGVEIGRLSYIQAIIIITRLQGRLGGGPAPPPDPPQPPDPPSRTAGQVRLFGEPESGVVYRFMSTSPVMKSSQAVAFTEGGAPTAWLNYAQLDPGACVDQGEGQFVAPVGSLFEPSPGAMDKAMELSRAMTAGVLGPDNPSTSSRYEEVSIQLGQASGLTYGLQVYAVARPYSEELVEVSGYVTCVDYHTAVRDVKVCGVSVVSEHGASGPVVWQEGQTHSFRFLRGAFASVSKPTFEEFRHYLILEDGPRSYTRSPGWGPMRTILPRLGGTSLLRDRNWEGSEEARQILLGESPQQQDGRVGFWRPRGARTGGGSGGVEIHPYSCWGQTPGELKRAWEAMVTMQHRMLQNYDHEMPAGTENSVYAKMTAYQKHDTAHLIRAMVDAIGLVWGAGDATAARWLVDLPDYYGFDPSGWGSEFSGRGHKFAHRAKGWELFCLATAVAVSAGKEMRYVLGSEARRIFNALSDVAMPSGITHRSGDIYAGGPFAAHLNPNLWQIGELPAGTTVCRTFMVAIVALGVHTYLRVFGNGDDLNNKGRSMVVRSADTLYFQREGSPAGHMIVGRLLPDEVYPTPYFSPQDKSTASWEPIWHLVCAYELTGYPQYLRKAVEIAGGDPEKLDAFPAFEYAKQGSARAWWDRTAGLVGHIQAL